MPFRWACLWWQLSFCSKEQEGIIGLVGMLPSHVRSRFFDFIDFIKHLYFHFCSSICLKKSYVRHVKKFIFSNNQMRKIQKHLMNSVSSMKRDRTCKTYVVRMFHVYDANSFDPKIIWMLVVLWLVHSNNHEGNLTCTTTADWIY